MNIFAKNDILYNMKYFYQKIIISAQLFDPRSQASQGAILGFGVEGIKYKVKLTNKVILESLWIYLGNS